jgi:hypothetical protein
MKHLKEVERKPMKPMFCVDMSEDGKHSVYLDVEEVAAIFDRIGLGINQVVFLMKSGEEVVLDNSDMSAEEFHNEMVDWNEE